jgi:hypothetical protein
MWSDYLQQPWVIAGVVVMLVIGISLLSRVASGVRDPVPLQMIEHTDVLLRSANRWALAATQDKAPLLALMHICYAKAYVVAVRRIMTDEQLRDAHNVNMIELIEKMDQVERQAVAAIATSSPNLVPGGEFAMRTGWLG